MLFRGVLLLLLVAAALFAWKSWRHYPGLAVGAAVVAAFSVLFLYRSPLLAGIGLAVAASLIWYLSRTRH